MSSGPINHGGYSDIYQGELTTRSVGDQDKLEVAIKLLRVLSSKGYDETKAKKRLNREVYVWHRLDHPNIATFLGTSYHMENRPSLILPWFKNGSASEYLRLRNPGADRLRLILDVAEGLDYLHTYKPAPIVHGDLKGNNILITDSGRATLSDFGLSQVIEDLVGPTGITPSMFQAGPIRWQSPELLMDISETCRPQLPGDVWSFGCTAYELLTGNVPYHFRLRDPTVIHDIQAGVPPPGAEENDLNRGDGGIWDLMNDCWIRPPAERIRMIEIVGRLKELCSRSSSPPYCSSIYIPSSSPTTCKSSDV
ncbi:kinase-like domain-containing protein [Lentinula aciculospora]|uniref:Kinase-like domain-containing protein n=1 Tax=Lentinula aciculospora TaxID=153920 RepID=A0A9W9DG80_9AGAR|nr:kinase-like domain-containing protein [Lentinula aciculospora]